MATVSISVVAGGNTKTVTKTTSAGDLVRFLEAHKVKYANGEVPLTDDQAIDAWAAEIFAEAKRYTKEHERQLAAPAEIVFT